MNEFIGILKLIGWMFLFTPVAVVAAIIIVAIYSFLIFLFEEYILIHFK